MDDALAAWSRRLRASDPDACTELFRALHAPLLRYAARLTGDEDAAYDVVILGCGDPEAPELWDSHSCHDGREHH